MSLISGTRFHELSPLTPFVFVGTLECEARRKLGEYGFDGVSVIIKISDNHMTTLGPLWNNQMPGGTKPILGDASRLRNYGVIPLQLGIPREELIAKINACGDDFAKALERDLTKLAT